MNKKVTAIGLTAGLLAGAGAGYILQNSGSAGASNNAAPVVSIAAGNDAAGNGTANTPLAGSSTDIASVLAPLVTDGTLTQAQADKVIAALQAAGVRGGGGMPGGMGGDDGGQGLPGGDGGMGGMGGAPGMGGGLLDTVASTIGISVTDLQSAIAGGTTIAQIAEANGSSAQQVIDALVAQMKTHFDAEVKTGEHTQADADQRIADFTAQITEVVNNTQNAPLGGPGGRGPGDGDGDHGGMPGGIPGDDNDNGNGIGNGNGPSDTATNSGI